MGKDFINILSEDYEVKPKTIAKMAKLILSSEGVNENNFEIILETAVSNFSSSKPIEGDNYLPNTKFMTIESSVQYALNLEVYNNKITNDDWEKSKIIEFHTLK